MEELKGDLPASSMDAVLGVSLFGPRPTELVGDVGRYEVRKYARI